MANVRYNKRLGEMIAEVYASGEQSIEEICKHFQINKSTFYEWKKSKTDFSDSISHYENLRLENIGRMALSGLALMIQPHEYIEERIEYETVKSILPGGKDKQVVRAVTHHKKKYLPNARLIEFALSNRLPDLWKNTSKIDVTSNGQSLGFGQFLMGTMPNAKPEEKPSGEVYIADHREGGQ